MNNKIKLGALALIALATGASAFSAKAKTAKAHANISKLANFTYYVYQTLTGGTKLVTTTFNSCPGGSNTCQARFSAAFQLDGTTKWEPAANKTAVLAHRN